MPSHVYDVAFSRSGAKCSVASVDSKVYVVDLRMCCVCWSNGFSSACIGEKRIECDDEPWKISDRLHGVEYVVSNVMSGSTTL